MADTVIRPGDTVIFAISKTQDDDDHEQLLKALMEWLPGVEVRICLNRKPGEGLTLVAHYRS